MVASTRQNVADSSKLMGEVDTRAPFESVKAAVSLFGEAAFSPDKPAVRKQKGPLAERALAKETQLHLAEKELNKFKEQLKNAETTRIQALAELEQAKRTVDVLASKLKTINESKESVLKATEVAKIQTKQSENLSSSCDSENGHNWKHEMDNAREQYAITIKELDAAKQELRRIKKDFEISMDAKVSAFQQEAEARQLAEVNSERASQLSKEIAAARESLEHVKLAFVQAQQEESKISSEKDVSRQAYRHALEETEKRLASLKKEFDPELAGNLEAKLASTSDEIGALKKEMENVKLSDLDSVATVTTELDGAKEVLHKLAEEESSLRGLMESLQLELENVKKEHLDLKAKEAETESVVSELHIKLQKSKGELVVATTGELKAQAACDNLLLTLQQLTSESENARKESETVKNRADEFRREAETSRISLNEAEKKLQIALRDAEAAKAAETNALNEIKILSEKANAARASTSESGAKITISREEYESLSRKVGESETLAEMKVAAALAQVEAIRAGENEAIKRLEATRKEMEEMEVATQEAMKRAEMAEAARRAVEGEMKRWREREQKRAAEAASRIFAETQMPKAASPPQTGLSKSSLPVKNEGNRKSGKTATKKTLLPQLSGLFQRKRNQVEGSSPSYLPGEKPV
ncbi:hypothetical protein Taro_036686 [Colocasia esculenta]|uniref:WEB family protein n=1 Tax=Colocasia esculenta TaxID=4460 RepID=A0A843W280_COLES|nr:hypothetical protein [Colocasia esculenta]